jgi:hypothetical protein
VADTVQVVFATYGALSDGYWPTPDGQYKLGRRAEAQDVTKALQTELNKTNLVTINNANMGGDPAPKFDKHFGAIVEYKGQLHAYACHEDQTIDFSQQTARLGGDLKATGAVQVVYAVYGALDGNQVPRAQDAKEALQTLLNKTNVVTINNANMGGDPAVGFVKHFGAYVHVNPPTGETLYFACQEGQTIDFSTKYGPIWQPRSPLPE